MTILKNTVCLYGGSFDPPHAGHMEMVKGILSKMLWGQFGPSQTPECWVLVQANHAFGKKLTDPEVRRQMVETSIFSYLSDPPFLLSQRIKVLVDTNSYMIDTIMDLQSRHPSTKFILAMGSDCYAERHRWHRWAELESLLEVAVIPRVPNISSTQVREKVRTGDLQDLKISPVVLETIQRLGLYRGDN